MAEPNCALIKRERTTNSFPLRTTLYAAGAGLCVGVLLTAAAVYLFSPSTQSPTTQGLCSTPTPSLPWGCQWSQRLMKTFTIYTEEKKNWYEALADCHKRGMLFAALDSEEEFQEVLRLINAKRAENKTSEDEDFWVSGTDLGHNGTFVWISTGRDITVNRWFRDEESGFREPTNGDFCGLQLEHCVELMHSYHYEMNDNCCLHRQSYVCQSLQCSH